MQYPYCKSEMSSGDIIGDGRTKVRWQAKGEKLSLLDKAITEKGCIKAGYSLTQFKLSGEYCKSCNKIIIDTGVLK